MTYSHWGTFWNSGIWGDNLSFRSLSKWDTETEALVTDPETLPSLCIPEVLWLPPLGEGALASWGGGGHQLPALTSINTPTAQPLQTSTLGSKSLSALQIPLQTMSRVDPSN